MQQVLKRQRQNIDGHGNSCRMRRSMCLDLKSDFRKAKVMQQLEQQIQTLLQNQETFPVKAVDLLLSTAHGWKASDLHLIPSESSKQLQSAFRINGVLQPGPVIPMGANVVSRLKVVANLLTYRTDVPQEGRVKSGLIGTGSNNEIRISTFPTIHGEKAVVRFFVGSGEYHNLTDLGLPDSIQEALEDVLSETSGLLLACGPAGSGKTTTLYAALRYLQQQPQLRSLCTLEDPIEAVIPGIAQSQIRADSGFTYQRGMISMMRQDPDIIMIGEIRNHETAEVVVQAAFTGHLILSSFHSASAADAISRLLDMGIEPYVLRSTISGILAQRLLRKSCECSQDSLTGCEKCLGTGYSGRLIVAEMLQLRNRDIYHAIQGNEDAAKIQARAVESGMIPLIRRAADAVQAGETTFAECLRVFGPSAASPEFHKLVQNKAEP